MTPTQVVEELLDEGFGFKAAVKIGSKIFTGAIHGDALVKAADAGALKRFGIKSSNDMEDGDWDTIEQSIVSGFVKGGKFYTRQQTQDFIERSGRTVDVSRDDGVSAEDLETIRRA